METDEGMDAPSPCYWCTRDGYNDSCRVWKDKEEFACAYCKRHGKSGCKAREKGKAAATEEEGKDGDGEDLVEDDESGTMAQRVGGLEDELDIQAQKIRDLEQDVTHLKAVNEAAKVGWANMQATVSLLWQQSGLQQQ